VLHVHCKADIQNGIRRRIVSKNVRALSIIAMLLVVISFNVAGAQAAATQAAVAETGLPCYDMWQRCLDGGGSAERCDGVWCGCMEATYGYVCAAQVV
jgi:hypothetical protein